MNVVTAVGAFADFDRERRVLSPRFMRCAFLAVALMACSEKAQAGQLDDAENAMSRQEYSVGLKTFRRLAAQGDSEAQLDLGLAYKFGWGVPQDYVAMAKWYRTAAENRNGGAQISLGLAYAEGQGVPQSDAEAMKWYLEAAEEGYAVAQHNLGSMFAHGTKVGKATVLPVDHIQAYKWYSLAASQYTDEQKGVRQLAIEARIRESDQMTPAQIKEAQQLVAQWTAK
jgi:TPR repeat protein